VLQRWGEVQSALGAVLLGPGHFSAGADEFLTCDFRRVISGMSDSNADLDKVVVNRALSLDGFIAGPNHAMGWALEYMKKGPVPRSHADHRRHARRAWHP